MAKYRATSRTFVDGTLYQPDAEFESAQKPSRTWHPLDDAAMKAFQTQFPGSVSDGVVHAPLGPIDLLPKTIDPKDAILKETKS